MRNAAEERQAHEQRRSRSRQRQLRSPRADSRSRSHVSRRSRKQVDRRSRSTSRRASCCRANGRSRSRASGHGCSRASDQPRAGPSRERSRASDQPRAGPSRERSQASDQPRAEPSRERSRASDQPRAGPSRERSRASDQPRAGPSRERSRASDQLCCRASKRPYDRVRSRSRSPVHGYSHNHETRQGGESNSSKDSLMQLLDAIKCIGSNDTLGKLGNLQNTVPEFDPARKEQTMTMWLHKVNECASIYGWSEKQLIHYALPKLKGVAQRWYEGLSSVLFSWEEWQTKLLTAFPSEENYGQMLSDMLAKRARFGDSLETYFYDKTALINRCGITGRRAVECILHGVDDRSVRLGAEAVQYDNPDKLLAYLRNARNSRPQSDRRPGKPNQPIGRAQDNTAKQGNKPRCFNCMQEGHSVSQCTLPIKKCDKCHKLGHETEKCYSNTKLITTTEKSVMSVLSEKPGEKYFKTALVNNIPFNAFIDFGSECCMIRLSEFKSISQDLNVDELPTLKGFGNSVLISIDEVEAEVDLFVVPDNAMHVPVMVGQTFTEQPHVVVYKNSEILQMLETSNDLPCYSKIKLICSCDVTLSGGVSIVEVNVDPTMTGEVYVEGGIRLISDVRFSVLPGLFSVNEDGFGNLLVSVPRDRTVTLKKGYLLARGRAATEDNTPIAEVLQVSASENEPLEPIADSDIKVGDNITPSQKKMLRTLLNNYRECFASSLSELGKTSVGEMSITLNDDEPVVYRPYRLSIKEKEIVRDMVTELLEYGIIQPSTSPYASPIVLVRKKTGDYRMCIDYRALNKKTVKENYPMPLIDDQLDVLAGHKFYTTLDLASGYYQIPIRNEDKYKTAFVTPDGHFEFNRMPFGLANAPATFQRIMNQVLGSTRHREALAYLDDVIIPAKDFSEGLARLENVLKLFSEAGLTLKLSKCVFFGHHVDYLGFEISQEGIRPGSRKIEAVEGFPVPQNQHNVRQFLGLASFFRRFVPGFSIIAKPLTYLLKKDTPWVWGEEQNAAFRTLQKKLTEKPTLALYDPQAETELHTDACKIGLGGILLQRNEQGVLRPVAYFSRQTTPEEQNYSSYDLETLAVVSALRKFRVYLVGLKFKIVTDCNSLRATFQKRDMLPRVARWWELMQEYQFDIEYRAGVSMAHVDALSRNPILNNSQQEYDVMNIAEENWLVTVQNSDSDIQRIVERYNKVIVDASTAKSVGTADNKWDDHLPDVQWGMNNTFNKGINRTPAEALFGVRPPVGTNESRILSELSGDTNTNVEGTLDADANRNAIRENINTHIETCQQKQKEAFDKHRCQPTKYQVGDLVRVERQVAATGQSKKLIPKYQGPYRITAILDHDRYHVEDTPLTKKSGRRFSTIVAVDKIRLWLNFNRPHEHDIGVPSKEHPWFLIFIKFDNRIKFMLYKKVMLYNKRDY
ncbi:hypothetical protein ABMA28_003074 [Loxostege sticticalis]|uniref:Reverse transcriptase n=1 Tax=Loxostege sticticalis TaxID=481309 RepID=A0ABD0SUY4_LOXSC